MLLLTEKVKKANVKIPEKVKIYIEDTLKKAKKDKHSTVGLTKSVNKRKKLLSYLKRKNAESYNKVLKQLNLRK